MADHSATFENGDKLLAAAQSLCLILDGRLSDEVYLLKCFNNMVQVGHCTFLVNILGLQETHISHPSVLHPLVL